MLPYGYARCVTDTTFELPSTYTRGYVVGTVIYAIADNPTDADRYPEARGAAGTVTFEPLSKGAKVTDADYPAIVMNTPISATLSPRGVLLDANLEPGIWLIAGDYKVSFTFAAVTGGYKGSLPPFNITVTEAHTEEAPLNLATEVPSSVPTGANVTTLVVPAGAGILQRNATTGALEWVDPSAVTGEVVTWDTLDKPAVLAEGSTAAEARAAISAQVAGDYATTAAVDGVSAALVGISEAAAEAQQVAAEAQQVATEAQQLAESAAGGPSSPPITVDLTANTTWGSAADLAGLVQNDAHLVRFQQDSLGGHALTWGSGIVPQYLPLVSQVDGAETSVLLTYSPAAAGWFAGHLRTYVPPDTVPPNPGVLAATSVTDTSISLRCSGASDLRELGTLPYEFSLDGGQTWSAPQQSQDYSSSGLTTGQTYPCRVRVSDSSGNTAEASVSVITVAALIALDTFTRADTSGLGVTETGALAWETPAGVWGISQGRASITTKSGATDFAVINIGRSTNFAVEVEVVSTPQVSFRYADPANRFAFGAKDSSTLYLRRFVSGVSTTLGAEFAHATVTGDRFRVAVVGDVITCSVQSAGSSTWTQAVQVTDSALAGGTRVGMNRYGVAGAIASSIMVEPQ